jgi:hypothetical protein
MAVKVIDGEISNPNTVSGEKKEQNKGLSSG